MCGIKLTLFKLRLIIKKLSNVKFCTYSILQFFSFLIFAKNTQATFNRWSLIKINTNETNEEKVTKS